VRAPQTRRFIPHLDDATAHAGLAILGAMWDGVRMRSATTLLAILLLPLTVSGQTPKLPQPVVTRAQVWQYDQTWLCATKEHPAEQMAPRLKGLLERSGRQAWELVSVLNYPLTKEALENGTQFCLHLIFKRPQS
jgi:hypothetical protein